MFINQNIRIGQDTALSPLNIPLSNMRMVQQTITDAT